jgi:DNA polymerase III delta subunit
MILMDGPQLQAHLQNGPLRAAYLVVSAEQPDRGKNTERVGADPQALNAAAKRIENAALSRGDRTLDYQNIDYADGDYAAISSSPQQSKHHLIAHEARASSLFGGRRVITVCHVDDFVLGAAKTKGRSKAAKEGAKEDEGNDPVEQLLLSVRPDDGDPPFVLIFTATHLPRTGRFFKLICQMGAVVEVAAMTSLTLQTYLESTGATTRTRIERGVAQKIWDRLGGTDPARLRQTADRLLLDAGPDGTVTMQSVDSTVPLDRDAGAWVLTDAIATDDPQRAVTVLHLLIAHVEPTERDGEVLRILGFLASHYQLMLQIQAGLSLGRGDDEICSSLGLHPFRFKNIAAQLRSSRPGRLEMAVATLATLDLMLKSTAIGDRKVATLRWLEQGLLCLTKGTPLALATAPSIMDSL